jgi:hypothetical protein
VALSRSHLQSIHPGSSHELRYLEEASELEERLSGDGHWVSASTDSFYPWLCLHNVVYHPLCPAVRDNDDKTDDIGSPPNLGFALEASGLLRQNWYVSLGSSNSFVY